MQYSTFSAIATGYFALSFVAQANTNTIPPLLYLTSDLA